MSMVCKGMYTEVKGLCRDLLFVGNCGGFSLSCIDLV